MRVKKPAGRVRGAFIAELTSAAWPLIAKRDRAELVKRALITVLLLVGVGYAAACAYLWTQ